MILPPVVVVVLTQASVVKVSGEAIGWRLAARPVVVPLNVVAVSASLFSAPAVARVTPADTRPSLLPRVSTAEVPAGSSSRQYVAAPCEATSAAYSPGV